MPRMDGEELYKEVFALDRDQAKKMIFASREATDFIQSTGNPFLEKPFFREELIKSVKRLTS
jgi:hypothetical protein